MKYFFLLTMLAVASPAFAYSSYDEPSGFAMFLTVLTFVGALLNIILFFKIWGMTNNVKRIKEKMVPDSSGGLTEELNMLHFMGKDKECEEIILREFYSQLRWKLNSARINMTEEDYNKTIDEPISNFTDIVAVQYKKIGKEMPEMIKNLKTYRDFLKSRITDEEIEYPSLSEKTKTQSHLPTSVAKY